MKKCESFTKVPNEKAAGDEGGTHGNNSTGNYPVLQLHSLSSSGCSTHQFKRGNKITMEGNGRSQICRQNSIMQIRIYLRYLGKLVKVGKSSVGICDVIKKPPNVAYFIKTGGD